MSAATWTQSGESKPVEYEVLSTLASLLSRESRERPASGMELSGSGGGGRTAAALAVPPGHHGANMDGGQRPSVKDTEVLMQAPPSLHR